MADKNLYVFRRINRNATGDKTIDAMQDWIQQVQDIPIIDGKLLSAKFIGGVTTLVQVKHNMGRAYLGGIICSQDNALSTFVTLTPELTKRLGLDPTKVIPVAVAGAVAPAADVNLTLWVF